MTCFAPHPRLLIQLSELFTTPSSGRPIRFLRIVTPTGRGKTAHAVNAHANSSKCRFSRQMKVISVVSDIWCPSFIRQKQAFNINSKIYRKHGTVSPRKFRSSGPMIQKSCPRIGIPVPNRTKHVAGHRCWMKIGVCDICQMEICFGLHPTGSRKFYCTLMDLIDDYNAMIARRPCHMGREFSGCDLWTGERVFRFRSVSSPVSVKGGLWSIGQKI